MVKIKKVLNREIQVVVRRERRKGIILCRNINFVQMEMVVVVRR